MNDYEKIIRLTEKEIITDKELQIIMKDDCVSGLTQCENDKKHPKLPKYEVRISKNGYVEVHWVYVKKPFFQFF